MIPLRISSIVANFTRASMIAAIILAAKKKEPLRLGPKTPIPNLTKKGMKFWKKHFWPKYGKIIKKQTDPDKKMATAIAIWRNSATKHNIAPFDAEETILTEDMKDYMQQRIVINRKKLFDRSISLLKKLKKSGLIKRVLNERIAEVEYGKKKPSFFSVSTESVLVPENGIDFGTKDLSTFLKNKGFVRKKGRFLLPSVGHGDIEILPSEDAERLIVKNTLYYTPQHIKFIFDMNEDDLKDKKKIFKKLSARAKKLLKEGKLGNKLVASVLTDLSSEDLIDFTKSLDNEQTEMLSKFEEGFDKVGVEGLKGMYSMDRILSLGDPLYQYHLVKMLVAHFEDEKQSIPEVWSSILENPNVYLNPILQEIEDVEEEEDPESDV